MLHLVQVDAKAKENEGAQIAAVDLGSNSFRLQIGRVVGDQIYPMDSLKESVRLAAGLTPEKMLDEPSQQRALAALNRFGERLRCFRPASVRVVATNTFRVARNASGFLQRAEEALGFPIEVIGGREEARLIYLGVAHSLPATNRKRLVVDIGGGSTEFIIGRSTEPGQLESLYMGCVSYSMRYFPGGRVDKKRFGEAEVAAAREIERIVSGYKRVGWDEAIGSSGTARAIADLLELNRLNPEGRSGITRSGLNALRSRMISAGSVGKLNLPGVPVDRLPVLPGGLAIMCAVFEQLGIEQMNYADGALRLGVLYDLLGRFHQRDMRDTTVRQFKQRYQLDPRQAARVCQTAAHVFSELFDVVAPEQDEDLRMLKWAAELHEIGISIAHSGFHKHGAYILGAADMPGFSRKEQSRLAQLILGHRGKLEKITELSASDPDWHILFCLRLAAAFHRARNDYALPDFHVKFDGDGYRVELPAYWQPANPLSSAVLADEALAWQRIGIGLHINYKAQPSVAIG